MYFHTLSLHDALPLFCAADCSPSAESPLARCRPLSRSGRSVRHLAAFPCVGPSFRPTRQSASSPPTPSNEAPVTALYVPESWTLRESPRDRKSTRLNSSH